MLNQLNCPPLHTPDDEVPLNLYHQCTLRVASLLLQGLQEPECCSHCNFREQCYFSLQMSFSPTYKIKNYLLAKVLIFKGLNTLKALKNQRFY